MTWFQDHLLTCIIFLPILGAIAVGMMGGMEPARVRRLALLVSLATLAMSLLALDEFVRSQRGGVATPRILAESADWLTLGGDGSDLPRIELRYSLALDGISLPLLLLTALLTPLAILASFSGIRERHREYYALILLLHGAMLGVFCARDLLLFYVFFEFTLIPLYFIIALWGGSERRRAANTFFLYTLAGSVLTFAGVLYLGWVGFATAPHGSAVFSFDCEYLTRLAAESRLSPEAQWWLFLAFFAGFAIKVPLFPFHTWLPLAHTEAPTAGSALLAGVLLKLGTYGFLRISLPMFPTAAMQLAPVLATLAVIGVIYGAVAAWVQNDIKKLVAYSSVSHLGFCILGLFCMNMAGLTGSLLYMVNHGLSTAALFFIVGMIYERYHTRDISKLGGLARKMPVMAFFLIVFTLASIGLPGLNGFVSEFLVLLGVFTSAGDGPGPGFDGPLGVPYAAFAATGIILSAVYLLHMCQYVLFGPLREPEHAHAASASERSDDHAELPADLSGREVAVLAPIAVLCLWLGVLPSHVLGIMQPELQRQTRRIYDFEPSPAHRRSTTLEDVIEPMTLRVPDHKQLQIQSDKQSRAVLSPEGLRTMIGARGTPAPIPRREDTPALFAQSMLPLAHGELTGDSH